MGAPEPANDVRHAVENLLFTYARLADDLDAAGIGQLMARATLRSGGDASTGTQAVVDRLSALFVGVNKSRHLMSNIRIDIAPDGRSARAGLLYDKWEIHDEPVVMASGAYESEFARDDDGWFFTAHEVKNQWRRPPGA